MMTQILYRSKTVLFVATLLTLLTSSAHALDQLVYLDFVTGNDGNINYTPAIRAAVETELTQKFQRFDVTFTQNRPTSGQFTTLRYNSGFPGGIAEQIDFRNLDKSDNAQINVDGFPGINTPSAILTASATIGAHELGHLLGLRHGDSFGPIGSGIGSTGPGNGAYLPTYPGPANGNEINNHVMGTPAIGANNIAVDAHLSERSATKLEFARAGTVINEAPGSKSTLATAQPIMFDNMTVPNTIESGQNAGLNDFSVDALSVLGGLNSAGQVDMYEFEASAGDLFNFEVMSQVLSQRIGNSLDTQISILDDSGSLIPYFGDTAFNDDEFETLDSILIDLTIPSDGTYFIQINAFSTSDTGDYELFGYRFNGEVVPEPSSAFTLLAGMSLLMLVLRRRK